MAGWIAERFGCRLWMSRLEYLTCRLMAADTGCKAPNEGIEFYRAAGWDESAIERYKARFGTFGEMIYPLPAAFQRLYEGQVLEIGSRDWKVVVGRGHSPEHACLYCPELKLFISGDQVLPKITSNVSVHPTEPEADPLADWLDSLSALKTRVPDDVLVLPAHNSPFKGLHARVDQLLDGHRQGLGRLTENLSEALRTTDLFGSLFSRPITGALLGLATGETLAHLNHLRAAGVVVRETDNDGVWWWRRVSP
jgi:glyoxylase-like metal-dependent hydrolase (beta-lactamase superfamily II)